MGTQCIEAPLKEDSAGIPSVPPGFASCKSFTLERIIDVVPMSSMDPASDSLHAQMEEQSSNISDEKFRKSLRRRPWINYSQFDGSSEEESDSELFEQNAPSISCLPRGIIRGCPECKSCQKVTARWQPKDAHRPVLDEAPVFYPNEEEFKDTLKYIASIQPKAEPYGICRIVPPPSWNPPCPLKEKSAWENSKFCTRIQQIDKLQNRHSLRKLSRYDGLMKRKRRRLLRMGVDVKDGDGHSAKTDEHGHYNSTERFGFEPGPDFTLESFKKYADDFMEQYFQAEESDIVSESGKDQNSRQWKPSVENIEGEYWRMVEKPTEEIEVLYGADLETGVFGSGFPKMSSASETSDLDEKYVKSGWNLNNLARLSGSLLAFESGDISGVLVPWLYVGMCFSSFCWHVEDHHLYSLNYMHWGAPKVWYGIPGGDALKLEAAMKNFLPDLFEEQPDLLHKLVTQFSPSILQADGVPVFKCIQNPREFVLTFPRAYHSGFNCGFNCAEAVNVAPIGWLPHGQFAVELYCNQGRKISISHDKLLLGAAREAVRAQWNILFLGKNSSDNLRWKDTCGPDGVLAKALKARIDTERLRREYLCCSLQSRKMDASFDAVSERECVICYYDLHLSASCCSCSSERFACLNHAKQMCSCTWSMRFFLFRYEISDLNILLDAVCGKLSAVHRWGLLDLGLSLSSYVSKDKMQESESVAKKSSETYPKEQGSINRETPTGIARNSCLLQDVKASAPRASSSENPAQRNKGALNVLTSARTTADPHPSISNGQSYIQRGNKKEAVGAKEPCPQVRPLHDDIGGEDQTLQVTCGVISSDVASLGRAGYQLSQEGRSCSESREQKPAGHSTLVPKAKPLSNLTKADNLLLAGAGNVIVLSDNEAEGAGELPCKSKEEPVKEISDMLTSCNDKLVPCSYQKDQVHESPVSNASVTSDGEINSTTQVDKVVPLLNPPVGVKGQLNEETNEEVESSLPNQSLTRTFSQCMNINRSSTSGCSVSNNGTKSQHSQLHGSLKTSNDSKDGKNGIERYNQQKGPRMAKVVRRIKNVVEPLTYGVVLSGRLWSSSQVIFPKGYRSRVKYFSVLDPTQMCYYVSEILDAGLLGPLFMVQVEQSPSEVFIHVSAIRCWDMVRERVNYEIRRQHSLGKTNVPTLQPPGSLDGLEMFGLSSPSIIQAIEAIDVNRVCSEYWRAKAQTQDSQMPVGLTGDCGPPGKEELGIHDRRATLRGLLKKANSEELRLLADILGNAELNLKEDVGQLLNEEIGRRP